ncbi:hypothetical protein [Teichococcus oryzae]|uniref:DUF4258 domain-containing protein n=1 Tax=Teichococcus oryzae TaxID=1608942 RepID=A0A5B2TBL1_9PROT|nr:hypothetical protein [Pseudoroseomonas oryzae]KAA2211228.1 hypothetical protein F0Q34_21210 [Pseudoroseomonas oryzae]
MDHHETRHAVARRQGRAIPPFVIGLLMEQGSSMRHNGAEVYFMDKAARRRTKHLLGDRIHAALEQYLDAYVVCDEGGRVITTAWRTQRMKRR